MEFGPGFLATFLYYFTSTSLVCTLVITKGMGLGIETGVPQVVGTLSGIAAGAIGAYFNQTKTLSVHFQSQKRFLADLETALNQMGYAQTSAEADLRIYERAAPSNWFSGKVFVRLEPKMATIASRASNIRRLEKQVRA